MECKMECKRKGDKIECKREIKGAVRRGGGG